MIIYKCKKPELKTDHRRVTHWTAYPEDLLSWFDYFSCYLQVPCGIIRVESEICNGKRKARKCEQYALFTLDEVPYRYNVKAKKGYITRPPKLQEQLEKDDLVVSVGGKLMQYGDFMTKIKRKEQ